MPWIALKPIKPGGTGKPRGLPTAIVYITGELTITHAAAAMLGSPDRVRISYNPEQECIRLTPTTPDDSGGFTLSGGGNAPHRVSVRQMVTSHRNMVGNYKAFKIAGGVELRKVDSIDDNEDGELTL